MSSSSTTASSSSLTVEARFNPGPLGLSLSRENVVVNIVGSGQAETLGIQLNDALIMVGTTDVKGMVHEEVLNLIKSAGRPLTLTFSRGDSNASENTSSSATPTTTNSTTPNLPTMTSTVTAAQAVKKAGSLMKGILGAGVQVVKAFDRVIDKAIDDSAKQAKVSIRRALLIVVLSVVGFISISLFAEGFIIPLYLSINSSH